MTHDRYDLTRHETLRTPGRRRNEWNAGASPAVTDDSSKEFEIGSRWLNAATHELWTCLNAAVGAAVWKRGTGQAHHELQELGDDDHLLYGLVYSQADSPGTPPRDEALWFNTEDNTLNVWEPVSDSWMAVGAGYALEEHPHRADQISYEDLLGDFPLPITTVFLRPNGDVAKQEPVFWTNEGTQAAYQQVNEATLNTGTYVFHEGQYASFRFSLDSFPGLPTDFIRRVRLVAYGSVGATSHGESAVLFDESTDSYDVAGAVSWGTNSTGWRTGAWIPTCWWDGANWTVERLANIQIQCHHNGYLGGNSVQSLALEVEYDAGTTVQHAIEELAGRGILLDELGDVTAPTPADGDALVWDATATEWVPAAVIHGSGLDDLDDVELTTPADGDELRFIAGDVQTHPRPWAGVYTGLDGLFDYVRDVGLPVTKTASSVHSGGYYQPAWAVDGILGEPFHSSNPGEAWWRADFGTAVKVTVEGWGIETAGSQIHRPSTFFIEGSNDGVSYTVIHSRAGPPIANGGWTGGVVSAPNATPYRYIRLRQPAGGAASGDSYLIVREFEIWGVMHGPEVDNHWVNTPVEPPVLEHGGLTGLADDDHTKYGLLFSQASPPAAPARPEAIWIDTDGVPSVGGSLGGLSDVDVSGVDDGDSLIWDETAGEWVAAAPGALPLDGLTDVDTTGKVDGDSLTWDETAGLWVPGPGGGGGVGNAIMYSQAADPGTPTLPEALWYDTDAVAGGGGGGGGGGGAVPPALRVSMYERFR